MSKVVWNGDEDECWHWSGAIRSGNYGAFRHRGKTARAHRAAFELFIGPIPEGLDLDHLCRNRLCINPGHLEPVTRAENLRRGRLHHPRKTHCKRGHGLSGTNVRYESNGKRVCRKCEAIRSARWRAENLELSRRRVRESMRRAKERREHG